MYDARTLKPQILVSDSDVECPVSGCSRRVPRQRGFFQAASKFQCPEHKIYISPSTFEYPTELDNLLWKDEQDIALLRSVKLVKRESRMARDNSEDALSWNVFRYLEKTGYLSAVLSGILGSELGRLELVYWSRSPSQQGVWPELTAARREFGEHLQRSSEPDLIAFSDKAVLFIEAKLGASNTTRPSDPENQKKYVTGGDGWYRRVFASDYRAVAIDAQKYELLRFWLLGTWIAAQRKRDFYLVNLVRSERELAIETLFRPHIKHIAERRFLRLTWEKIYRRIAEAIPPSADRDSLLEYLEYKTVGYNRFGQLQRAFSMPVRLT